MHAGSVVQTLQAIPTNTSTAMIDLISMGLVNSTSIVLLLVDCPAYLKLQIQCLSDPGIGMLLIYAVQLSETLNPCRSIPKHGGPG